MLITSSIWLTTDELFDAEPIQVLTLLHLLLSLDVVALLDLCLLVRK